MVRIRRSAGHTLRLERPVLPDLQDTARYIFSSAGTEPRGRLPLWDECLRDRTASCIEIVESKPTQLTYSKGGETQTTSVPLNDDGGLGAMFGGVRAAYVDISGMPHHVWAPLIRVGLNAVEQLYAIYAEPGTYKKHPSPTSRTEFDLSEGFRGIEPLPGFAKLRGPDNEQDTIFVALLGFEGKRATHVALALDPVPRVFAVVGIPGFRVDYPQITATSNAEFVAEFRAHANLRYAAASCPFEAYDALREIQRDCGGKYMYIAPIGTKPHALGAICYVLRHPGSTELMYDNPIRKPGRTEGIGPVHIYKLKPSYVAP